MRVLETLTGLNDIYLEQIHTYSKIDRDPGQRTISVAYFALIDVDSHRFDGIQIDSAHWFDIKEATNLIFDHNEMIQKAKARLKRRALSKPIGFELLPEKFTMRQLQNLYESILDKKLDKRNFINKINSLDVLIKLDEKDMSVSRKGAYLYVFDKDKYEKKVEEDGFIFKIWLSTAISFYFQKVLLHTEDLYGGAGKDPKWFEKLMLAHDLSKVPGHRFRPVFPLY